ncbi:MAG: EamA family transporter [Thermovirgaceae bacterium]|nr:EamA family transporter [Thermovirgaceae bacterium]
MTERHSQVPISRWLIIAMFAALYVTWSTTYLAIHYMVLTIPPYLSSGMRFLVAGGILYAIARPRTQAPSLQNWRACFVTGALIILLGNGGIVWAQQRIPSGLTALLIATMPLWIVILNWLMFRQGRPSLIEISGTLVGFTGIAMLIGTSRITEGDAFYPLGMAVILASALSWAIGSLYSRHGNLPPSPLLSAGMQMLAGGALMLLVSLFTGEISGFSPASVSLVSFLGWAYLVVFGSLVGFVCYLTLMRACRPSRVATYAYVTPVGAVFLGWLIAGEAVTGQTLFAAAVIITAVFIIITFGPKAHN